MDSEKYSRGKMQIEKHNESNFFVWKQKVDLILTYGEVDEVVQEENAHTRHNSDFDKWTQRDRLAGSIICLSMSGDMAEHVRDASTAKDMLGSI